MKRIVIVILAGVLGACTSNPAQESGMPMVGSDKDEHGCKASAGYTWCAKTNECVRPWELAKEQGFEGNEEGFRKYCGTAEE